MAGLKTDSAYVALKSMPETPSHARSTILKNRAETTCPLESGNMIFKLF